MNDTMFDMELLKIDKIWKKYCPRRMLILTKIIALTNLNIKLTVCRLSVK